MWNCMLLVSLSTEAVAWKCSIKMLLLTIFAIFCAGVSLTDMLKLHILVNSDEASILD